MRDIGKARRAYHFPDSDDDSRSAVPHSVQPSKPLRPSSCSFISPASDAYTRSECQGLSNGLDSCAVSLSPLSGASSGAPGPQASSSSEGLSESYVNEPIQTLSSTSSIQTSLDVYRRDPFARYPMAMTPAKLRLVSLSMTPAASQICFKVADMGGKCLTTLSQKISVNTEKYGIRSGSSIELLFSKSCRTFRSTWPVYPRGRPTNQ